MGGQRAPLIWDPSFQPSDLAGGDFGQGSYTPRMSKLVPPWSHAPFPPDHRAAGPAVPTSTFPAWTTRTHIPPKTRVLFRYHETRPPESTFTKVMPSSLLRPAALVARNGYIAISRRRRPKSRRSARSGGLARNTPAASPSGSVIVENKPILVAGIDGGPAAGPAAPAFRSSRRGCPILDNRDSRRRRAKRITSRRFSWW